MIAAPRDTNDPPTAVVVIVAYNAGDHLQRCVDSLERQSFEDWEAVVWDNASSDGAVDRLRVGPRISIVKHSENLGFAAANNRAASLSRARYIVTLNPDAFPETGWLEHLVRAAKTYHADVVASLQLRDEDPNVLDGAGDCMSIAGIAWRGGYLAPRALAPSKVVEVFAACAAAALYRREALGGFEERFFCYYEDVDLGFRTRLMGGVCILEPRAVVRHVGSGSAVEVPGFAELHGFCNRLWTFMRDMPTSLLPIAIPAHVLITLYLLLRSPKLIDVRIRALKAAWRGRRPFLAERRCLSAPRTRALLGILSWSPLQISGRRLKTRPARSPQYLV